MPARFERLPPDAAAMLERSRGVFFARWEELLRLKRVVVTTSDPEDIHDLRVASRRFRAALELFYPFAPKRSKAKLRKSVRNLTRILGGLRNIDEALLFFQAHGSSAETGHSRICQMLSERRCRELRRIMKAIKAFDQHDLDQTVREMVAGLDQKKIEGRNRFTLLAYFSEVSIKLYLPIHSSGAFATVPDHRQPRHALRIAIKKWRYFLEIMAQVLDRDYGRILELLREHQSLLGRMNDLVVFGEMFRTLDLPQNDQIELNELLKNEEELLLESFRELVLNKPVNYTFLI